MFPRGGVWTWLGSAAGNGADAGSRDGAGSPVTGSDGSGLLLIGSLCCLGPRSDSRTGSSAPFELTCLVFTGRSSFGRVS